MERCKVIRIRPLSWRLNVQGKDRAERVRIWLQKQNFFVSSAIQELDFADPPVFGFDLTPAEGTTLTSVELQTMLQRSDEIETCFDF